MLVLLSPSKNLYNQPKEAHRYSLPRFGDESLILIEALQKKSSRSLQKLMGINPKLADLNVERYHQFQWPHTTANATPALNTFRGEVYLGLDAATMTKVVVEEADKRIRILSGLYGLLKPLDLIQPYRLEMGVELKAGKNKSLYQFWGSKITELLNSDLKETGAKEIINLASIEYSAAIQKDKLNAPVIDIQFLEERNGKLQFVSFTAKRSRGWMARYIAEKKIKKSNDLKGFDLHGYSYRQELSEDNKHVFIR